jgi:hypothetical protein
MIFIEPEWWEEWTYFDTEEMVTKIREDAPEDVIRAWEQLNGAI